MLRINRLVMDEYLVGPTINAPAYTDQSLNKFLSGEFDRMAIHAIVDNVSVSDVINVVVEHSANGIAFFTPKNVQNEISANNNIFTLQTNQVWGFDLGIVPSLDQVRLKVYFGAAGTKAHVKIYVSGRCPKPFP
jgi:hypothetical protein